MKKSMKKYKITNRLESNLRLGKILFLPREVKILDFKPTSDRFIVEEIVEEVEELIVKDIEKIEKKGETVPVVSKKTKLKRRKNKWQTNQTHGQK